MPFHGLSTAKLARAVGVHPNTVRLYEQWRLIPPVPRSPKGYRLYTPYHLNCLRLARLIMGGPWTGRPIRKSGMQVVLTAAQGDLERARELARRHLEVVHAEQGQADGAAQAIARWMLRAPQDSAVGRGLRIGDAARLLGLTVDILRNWEKNGLLSAPRDTANRYRLYGPDELDRLRVVRLLIRTGYSTMAVLRLLSLHDEGQEPDARAVLDTPRPDEEVLSAADRWISALADQEERARQIIELLQNFA